MPVSYPRYRLIKKAHLWRENIACCINDEYKGYAKLGSDSGQDVWYVDNRSRLVDIRILLMTARKVIICDGTSGSIGATMAALEGLTARKRGSGK